MLKCVTMLLTLHRYCYGFKHTLGTISQPNDTVWYLVTMEPPWYLNVPNRSCIPEGTYLLKPHTSLLHGQTWEVTNVPGRSDILFHTGNFSSQTEGCIMPGTYEKVIDGRLAVANSAIAMGQLLRLLADDSSHTLEIRQYVPPHILKAVYT
jgi:hypothetical protein